MTRAASQLSSWRGKLFVNKKAELALIRSLFFWTKKSKNIKYKHSFNVMQLVDTWFFNKLQLKFSIS